MKNELDNKTSAAKDIEINLDKDGRDIAGGVNIKSDYSNTDHIRGLLINKGGKPGDENGIRIR